MNARVATCGIAIGVVSLLAFAPTPAQAGPQRPTDEQLRAIQQKINNVSTAIEGHQRCRAREHEAREGGDEDTAHTWAEFAVTWATLVQTECNDIISDVDRDYDIPLPPNTTVQYNPDCDGAYGSCYGTKTDIRVDIHPSDFSDGPGLIASTKIHEYTHAQQIFSCMSSNPGYWDDCEFWYHFSEWEAYMASERAYDAGFVDFPPDPSDPKAVPPQKRRISDAIADYWLAAMRSYFQSIALWGGPDFRHVLAEQVMVQDFHLMNTDKVERLSSVAVTSSCGWIVMPLFPPMIELQPEQDLVGQVEVAVPPFAAPGQSCELNVVVDGLVTDVLRLVVVSSALVVPPPAVVAPRDTTVVLPFTVINRGDVTDFFNLVPSNPMGWATNVLPPVVVLNPNDSIVVDVEVTVPASAPPLATNLVFLGAEPMASPNAPHRASVSVAVQEADVALLGIPGPASQQEVGVPFIPVAVVRNVGHVDSFFDVYLEIVLPDDTLIHSQAKQVTTLSPGGELDVAFDPTQIASSGTYTVRAWTSLAGDARPGNDMAERDIEVGHATSVLDWDVFE